MSHFFEKLVKPGVACPHQNTYTPTHTHKHACTHIVLHTMSQVYRVPWRLVDSKLKTTYHSATSLVKLCDHAQPPTPKLTSQESLETCR